MSGIGTARSEAIPIATVRPAPRDIGGHLAHVDGLRAVAVLSVLAFHAGLPFARGGYVGVDIFFVISGFVIARLIKRRVESDQFSILHFWKRRVRRLLPAYGPVFLFTVVACWFTYLPEDLLRVGRSAIAVSFFSSNFLFWQESGYFATQAELKPLLHTWSLALEEQFYLIFPLLFPLVLRNRLLPSWAWIAMLAAGSLCVAEILLRVDPSAAFYMLPSRAWELALGILIVFLPPAERIPDRARTAVSILGLAAMAIAIVVFGRTTPFPGIAAMLPCLGAATAIWAGSTKVAQKTLETRPAQFFGRISFGEQLKARKRSVRFLGTFACPPAVGINRATGTDECSLYSKAALDWLTTTPEIEQVVLFARHSGYLYGPVQGGPLAQDEAMDIELVPYGNLPLAPLQAGYFARLDRTVAALSKAGKQVTIVLPVPEKTGPVPETLAWKLLHGQPPVFDEPVALYARRQNAVRSALSRIAGRYGAATVDPAEFLCDRYYCHAAINGQPLYYDDDHLSKLGALMLSERLLAATQTTQSPDRESR